MPRQVTASEREGKLLAERRLQLGASLAVGAIALAVIVLRYGVRNVFVPGWWRLW